METNNIIAGCFTGLIAVVLAVYVSFTVRGKGPILSNSYLWLSKQQKEVVDKTMHYRLVSIVYGGLCGIFAFLTIHIFTGAVWAAVAYWLLLACVALYAIYDGVRTVLKPNSHSR